jgi:two-component system, LytTR family, sensor kinase
MTDVATVRSPSHVMTVGESPYPGRPGTRYLASMTATATPGTNTVTAATAAAEAVRPIAADVRRWAGLAPRTFWKAQAIGWVMFGLVYFLALLPASPFPPLNLLVFKLFWSGTGIAISTALAVTYDRMGVHARRLPVAVSIAVIVSLVFGSAWVLGIGTLVTAMTGTSNMIYTASSFPFVALNHFLIILSWSLAYLVLSYWQRSQEDQRKSLAALSAAREAQLEMLRYQLNPHFLFNAMTSVRALIIEHPERARTTLSRLSDFLRYTLGNRGGTTVTVTEEIATVRDYLEIELVRFEERLDVGVTVEPAAANERIPGFLLHPLVENAIKYGATSAGPLRVRVDARVEHGALILSVSNTGTYRPDTTEGTGIGVRNVRDRLEATYSGRGIFTIGQDGEWVRAIVTIRPADGAWRDREPDDA